MIKNIITFANVMRKYYPEIETENTSADHDIVYFGGSFPEEITPEDLKAIDDCGFHWDEKSASWAMFT